MEYQSSREAVLRRCLQPTRQRLQPIHKVQAVPTHGRWHKRPQTQLRQEDGHHGLASAATSSPKINIVWHKLEIIVILLIRGVILAHKTVKSSGCGGPRPCTGLHSIRWETP